MPNSNLSNFNQSGKEPTHFTQAPLKALLASILNALAYLS
jgi:hypothetical protein